MLSAIKASGSSGSFEYQASQKTIGQASSHGDIDFDLISRKKATLIATAIYKGYSDKLILYGSNDNSNWTQLYEKNGGGSGGNNVVFATFDSTTAYRYYRCHYQKSGGTASEFSFAVFY